MKYISVPLICICIVSIGLAVYFVLTEKSSDPVNTEEDKSLLIEHTFNEYGFSLQYPDTFKLEIKSNGYLLINENNVQMDINPEQKGFGVEFATTENLVVEVNGKQLNKLKVTDDYAGSTYYMLTEVYPVNYNKNTLILFNYPEIDAESTQLFDEVIASIEFTRD